MQAAYITPQDLQMLEYIQANPQLENVRVGKWIGKGVNFVNKHKDTIVKTIGTARAIHGALRDQEQEQQMIMLIWVGPR